MKKQFLTIIFLCCILKSFAQSCGALLVPTTLEERTAKATKIVEGKIVKSQSYWDVSRSNIYTVHEVQIYKNIKSNNTTTIHVVTMGGQVDDLFQTVSDAATFRLGDIGVFFLQSFRGNISISEPLYELVGAAQGVVKYSRFTNEASDIFTSYKSIEKEVYGKIQTNVKQSFQVVSERPIPNMLNKRSSTAPVISNFSPSSTTAGTQSVLTITGSNFGTNMGSVSFPDANAGGLSYTAALDTQIVSWSDTEIQVEIPWNAGTGNIVVTNSSNESVTSSSNLTITFAHVNATATGSTGTFSFPNTIPDLDGNGGVTFVYHTEFNSSAAKDDFEGAFELWNCESDINFTFGGTTTTDVTADDGINVVRFDNGDELPSTTLGRVSVYYTGVCGGNAVVKEMDITWNDGANWHYGDGTPSATQYDFKSVALHELGHTQQLGHVINSDVVMHYAIGTGSSKYALNQNDIDGAVYAMGFFKVNRGCSTTGEMTAQVNCCDAIVVNTQPENKSIAENETTSFTVDASNITTIQWQVSTNSGSDWTDINNDSNYSGVTATTLTISNAPLSFNGYHYRAFFNNECDENVTSGEVTLTVLEYTTIPDANFEAALSAYDDQTGDGRVPTNNINTLTSLNVTNSNISDLIGIEDFTALQVLLAFDNNLTSLDVSNNTSLLVLSAYNNAINNLDLGSNTNYQVISLSNNDLSSFNATNFTSLGVLTLNNNSNLTSVDLSTATTIREFQCEGCGLTELNVKNGNNSEITEFNIVNNPNLYCVLVDDAADSTANWTNVDNQTSFNDVECTGYVTIPDTNFEAALDNLGYDDISGDGQVPISLIASVTELNIQNQGITDLTGIEYFYSLTTLFLGGNSITDLDLTTNPNLESLWVQNCGVETVDISGLTQLVAVSFSLNYLTTLDLSSNTSLERIFVNSNDLTELNIKNGNNANITTADFRGNDDLTCVFIEDPSFLPSPFTVFYDDQTNFTTTYYCDYTAVPDVNFEAALYDLGYDDISGDGQVPTDLVDGVTSLDISSKSISDLTGIEAFVALDELRADNNNISSVDFSSNTVLRRLFLRNNNINTLDLTSNTGIRRLLVENNGMTSLDVTGLRILGQLFAAGNNLTEMDLSTNVSLNIVGLGSNNLSYLNFRNGNNSNINTWQTSNNPNLTCISVDDVDYANTNFTNKDDASSYSNYCRYTAIPDMAFEEALDNLGYDDNLGDGQVPTALIEDLTSIDLGSQGIQDMTGIQDFVALQTLIADDNQFTSINLNSLTQLTQLNLQGTNVSSIDLSNNTLLRVLNLEETQLTTVDISANELIEELDLKDIAVLTNITFGNNIALRILDASFNDLTSLDLSALTALEQVRVNSNELTELNIQNGNNSAITTFNATGNVDLRCIKVDNVDFAEANFTNKEVTTGFTTTTYCNYTTIPDANFEAVLDGLGYDDISGDGQVPTALIEAVTELDVFGEDISDFTGISDFTALETLYCGANNMTSIDLSNNVNLVNLEVSRNSSLTSLNITGCTLLEVLEADDNNSLAAIDLSTNVNLVTVDLGTNQLTFIDLTGLVNLESIDLKENQLVSVDFSSNVALDLASITKNSTLTTLTFGNTPNFERLFISDTSVETIDLSTLSGLRVLDIQNTPLTALDTSSNSALIYLEASNASALTQLNLKNGNNSNITVLNLTGTTNLTCIQVDDEDEANTNFTNIDPTNSFSEDCESCVFSVRAILEGPYNTTTSEMNDDLRSSDVLPTTSPYEDAATSSTTVFETIGAVDWVEIQLRNANDINEIVARKSFLLTTGGSVRDSNNSPKNYITAWQGNYYVALLHRNHLAVVSNSPMELDGDIIRPTNIDFTTESRVLNGANAVIDLGNGLFAIPAGNVEGSGQIQNSGVNSTILQLGNSGYSIFDVDMNGQIQNTDVNVIRKNLGKGEQF